MGMERRKQCKRVRRKGKDYRKERQCVERCGGKEEIGLEKEKKQHERVAKRSEVRARKGKGKERSVGGKNKRLKGITCNGRRNMRKRSEWREKEVESETVGDGREDM